MGAFTALRSGIIRALRYWQVLVVLYLVNLITALLMAALPAYSLIEPAYRTAIHDAAQGVPAWMALETMLAPLIAMNLGGSPGLQGQGLWLLVYSLAGILPFAAWIPAAAVSGGALLVYAEAPQPFRWRRFWWGCWHWFGVFLLLGLAQGLLTLALFLPLILAGGFAMAAAGWTLWIVLPLLALLAVVWLAWMEGARLFAVAGGTRNVAAGFGRAVAATFRRPLLFGGFYVLAALLLFGLHALFRLGLMPVLPLHWWLLVLVLQQAFILSRLLARASRWAGGMQAARSMLAVQQENVNVPERIGSGI